MNNKRHCFYLYHFGAISATKDKRPKYLFLIINHSTAGGNQGSAIPRKGNSNGKARKKGGKDDFWGKYT